jgi:hypothetical protein
MVCSRATIASRPALEEVIAERLERTRLGSHEGATRDHDGVEVDADQALAELALLDPIEHWLDERAQAPCVAGADHVDRPAHEGRPNGLPIREEAAELVGLEALEALPQSDVRRVRDLRLHPGEPLDRRDGHRRRSNRSCRPASRGSARG